MNSRDAFQILGIEPTANRREIQTAYALLTRTTHPEDNPEGWQRLHAAYVSALQYAASPQPQPRATAEVNIPSAPSPASEAPLPEESFRELFDDLHNLSDAAEKQAREDWAKRFAWNLDILYSLRNKKKMSIKDWAPLFQSEDCLQYVSDGAFLREWGITLENKTIGKALHDYLQKQLKIIQEYRSQLELDEKRLKTPLTDGHKKAASGLFITDSYFYAQTQTKAAYANTKNRSRHILQAFAALSAVVLLIYGLIVTPKNTEKNTKIDEPSNVLPPSMTAPAPTGTPITPEDDEEETDKDAVSKMPQEVLASSLLDLSVSDTKIQEQRLLSDEASLLLTDGIRICRLEPAMSEEEKASYMFYELDVTEIESPTGTPLTAENAYAFQIISSDPSIWLGVLCCDAKALGFHGDYAFYHITTVGDARMKSKIQPWDAENATGISMTIMSAGGYYFPLLGQTVFITTVGHDVDGIRSSFYYVIVGERTP